MSTISNIHTAITYVSKSSNGQEKSVPLFGQRGVVTIAKADKNGNYGQHLQQTMFTSIPLLCNADIDFNNASVQNACITYFQTIQNQIVADNLKAGNKTITTEQLSQVALLAYLNDNDSGNSDKWDSARVASWFADNLAESIGVALIEKGFTDEKMEQSLVAYSALFSATFSGKGIIPRVKAVAIQKALTLVDSNSPLANDAQYIKFNARIQKTLNPVENLDELLGL